MRFGVLVFAVLVACASTQPPPLAAPSEPDPSPGMTTAPLTLIAGSPQIPLLDEAKRYARNQGIGNLVGIAKICVDEKGTPASVTFVRGTGSEDQDRHIEKAVLASWRYAPRTMSGEPAALCTNAAFHYAIR
jgi:hypothetical protein